ncbi:hypothetical protein Snoj_78120 [Streptomyces nojiriensis]|uniref:Extensin n=1 Tax=Streptomyces nojiriensis TaxID=66374 RepID=A0ABQ3T0H6_9ACTN|nr:hypothetical protein [Streptomyces nojiriensis]QTI47400.1 hypothetical protein JYK04_05249 [Streptomyces nojiriensis]GGR78505.1 hypothetical protein GCM10010205_04190 [Streptomyces nojiriensis]GHI73894.1 hypothetical protein Snoj_78120 [Streptomyces nojiriensis]
MADERNRWLDEAAAEKLLRGEPVEPVGPAADQRARDEAARLRAALDALGGGNGSLPAGTELPGEAAAVAAFRTARGGARPSVTPPVVPAAAASAEPLVDLGRIVPAPAPRRGRAVSFGLAAALASVAVGGLAAAAGAGLLERSRHDTAGPGPAMSVSAGEDPAPGIGSGAPSASPKPTPTPLPSGSNVTAVPGTVQPPGADGRGATPGNGASTGASSGSSATAGSGKDIPGGSAATGGTGGKDGDRDTFVGGDTGGKDRDRDGESRLKVTDLCTEFKAGRLDEARRERLSRLANGLTRIPDYCKSVLDDGGSGGPKRSGTQLGGTLRAPTLTPTVPRGSADPRTGR